ncbi:MAG: hypothetical protein ACRDL6_01595, partial [Solirubrobacterales bacterium]
MGVAVDTEPLLSSLEGVVEEAAGRPGRTLATATVAVDPEIDPSALGFGSRRARERWFCWEQPDRDGFALAGLGTAHEAVSRGPGRFEDLTRECAELCRDRLADEPADLPAGAG